MKWVLVGSLIALLTVGGRSSASTSQVALDFRCDQSQKTLKFSLGPHLTGSVALQGQEFRGEIAGTPFRMPTSCFNSFTSLLLDDFNFDGVRDLAAETSVGYMGVNRFYRIYFVNPRSGQMRPSRLEEVSQGMAEPLRKVVVTQQKSGPGQLQQVYCLRPDSSDLYLCRTGEVGPNAKGPSDWNFTWQTP